MSKPSKRQFGSSRLASLPNLPPIYLDHTNDVDSLVDAFQKHGVKVKRRRDHFAADAQDHVWLPTVGKNGWIILTKDQRFRFRSAEKTALIRANCRTFVLVGSNMSGSQIAELAVLAIPAMKRFIRDNPAPFIAKIYRRGKGVVIVKQVI